ncbi:thrombospondin-type laminin G domain and EAR repeat-containing protein-like [Octopus sinensis]|uniref:Thrombospondin-type laminin G domain and EAR repeat-containing protein-like n=1 Tax=Octopus sinensis TaxID=2607531 RepID=A0A6P7TTA7_9MOLL|nr:thrombospondin-type laminin G domain and EAR repeat-containing protein-like [Octopus sinensis]
MTKELWCFLFIAFRCNATFAFPGLCTDLHPVNLLALAIDASKNISSGIRRIFDVESQVGAFVMTHIENPPSFSANQIFTKCPYFPEEFSFFFTFKYEPDGNIRIGSNGGGSASWDIHDKDDKRVQCIFSLRNNKTGANLISLEIANHFVMFTYNRTRKKFFDVKLMRSQWHSAGVSVSQNNTHLVLDCIDQQKRRIKRTFPALMKITDAVFHLGECSKKTTPFQGLLKELLFLPGTDASSLACPQNRITAGSDNTLVSSGIWNKPQRLEDGSCTWKDMGNVAYDLQKNLLKVCVNGIWKDTPKTRSCRLDYFEWYQDIKVDGGAVDVEVFTIPGEGLFAAFASNSQSNNKQNKHNRSQKPKLVADHSGSSAVYKWSNDKLILYQKLPTDAAHSFKSFKMDNQFFLAVANYGASMNGSATSSTIFRWSAKRKKFRIFQILRTWTATDIEYFNIRGKKFIAVANYAKGNSLHTTSVIYRWNRKLRKFEKYQLLKTIGARDITAFSVQDYQFLIISHAFDGRSTLLHSVVYIWHNDKFVKFNSMETMGAVDWEYFTINDDHYLVVANSYNFGPQNFKKINTYNTKSTVYKLNIQKKAFEKFQSIPTYSAIDWEFFSIGDQKYLVVTNAQNSNDPHEHYSVIYRWQGVDQFVPIHRMKVLPSADIEVFHIKQDIFLLYANPKSNISQILRAKFV